MRSTFTFLLVLFTFSGLFAQTECTVKILYSINKSQPPSYTFKIDPVIEGAKYYWSFGDKTNSDSPSPTHSYRVSDTYLVQVKVVTSNGKSCYGEVKARFEGGTVATSPTILSGKGKVKMPGSNDGCRLLIYLENGTVLAPVEILPTFQFKDGQYIELVYELQKDKPSGCASGVSAKIHRIAEIMVPTVCTIPINFKKNDAKPVSYTFSTTELPADSKFYWNFGDDGKSESASPTYVFKKAGTWVINLKVVDKAGKVCYGETKATFEGETNPPVSARGKVKKSEATGCDLVIAIDNAILIPAKIATDFQLREGQYVEFTYEKYAEKVTNCKEGTDVKILTIKEIQTTPACKFEIAVKPKEATPKSFLFYTVSQAEIKTWKWSFGDGKGSELKFPEHAYEKTGTYEVSCTITTAAGCTETRIIKHTVLPAPLASCTGAISLLLYDATDKCNGKATVKLLDENAKEINGVNYLWSDGRTGSTAENLCPDRPYTVQAIIEGVCQKSTSFTMLSKPVWRVTTANGQSKFSVISPKDGIAYEWDFGNGMVLKGSEINYNFENDGIYNVTLKAVSGGDFSEYTQQIEVLKSVTSIQNIKKPQLEVYPNPVKDILKINFGNPVEEIILIEIMNISGQLTYSQQMTTDGFSQTAINVQHLKSGIYFLRVINGSKPFADRKFIKAD